MKIKIGFIGCGTVSNIHLKYLKNDPDVELVGFCGSRDFDKVKDIAAKYFSTAYPGYKKMLAEAKPDAVYILIPPFIHGQIEKNCAERGIHMFIEKPIALDTETARTVQESIEKNNIICSVGYHWRYSKATNKARKLLKNKEIGMVEGHWSSYFPESSEWWSRKEKSGGQIVEQTTHLFDLARYFCGEVERVYGDGDLRLLKEFEKININDCSVVTIRFKNGIIGLMVSRCCKAPIQIDLKIIAKDLTITQYNNEKLDIWQDDNIKTIRDDESTFGFKEENRVFIEAVKKKDKRFIKSSYEDAMKTLRLTLAAERAINKNEIVYL